jgi:pantoate--beta-alanine ligase
VEVIHTVGWMKQAARQARAEGRIIGFVPTMGALHAGHLSLVAAARRDCSPVVVSIFVNPKQFAPHEDLTKYPRPIDKDQALLEDIGVDYLFAPSVEEMYPQGFSTTIQVDGLSERLEGRVRPGHFRGVTTVVLKLLEIVGPQFVFFGRKDAQQLRIIRQMSRDLALDPEIISCPIVRESDGLAMSSRNAYLSPDQRRAATVLHRSLDAARQAIASGQRDAARLVQTIRGALSAEPLATVDYAEIVDAESFEPVPLLRGECLALIAARIGATRLIDNMLIEMETNGAGHSYRCSL